MTALQLRSFGALRSPQDYNLSERGKIQMRLLAAGAGGSGLDGDADDGALAGGARLSVVADQKMLDHFVDAGVFEAGELGVFVKGKIARASDETQPAEDSAGFALEGL
jgi:hypothetical protein